SVSWFGGVILNCCGKLDPKCASFARRGINADRTVHALGRFLHKRQSDARSGIFFHAMQAFEDPKNFYLMFAGNADAVISNPKADRVVARLATDIDFGRTIG